MFASITLPRLMLALALGTAFENASAYCKPVVTIHLTGLST